MLVGGLSISPIYNTGYCWSDSCRCYGASSRSCLICLESSKGRASGLILPIVYESSHVRDSNIAGVSKGGEPSHSHLSMSGFVTEAAE